MKFVNHIHSFGPCVLAIVGWETCANQLWAAPPLPVIPANVFYATNYGAVGDGTTNNAVAIQNAINAAGTAGGGTVEVTAAGSNYLCGPLTLKSSVNLQVDAGATLQMLPVSTWPNPSTPFIYGSSLHDVEISGAGTIDGNAQFGTGEWWGPVGGSPASTRPNFIQFSGCNRILIQDVTLQNPPTFHLMLKNNNVNITIQDITINTPGNSPNTDGMDVASTNILVQNCFISDGDDDIEIGGSGGPAAFITVTNCTFGTGHGVSFGSITSGDVSNVVVLNSSFNGTDYGIRLKSDNAASGGGSGGLCQDFTFANLSMTNIVKAPIVIYSYYNEVGTPTSITPQTAATEPVAPVTGTTVVWRNITFSNLTINTPGLIAGIIWGRIEMPVTNVVFSHVNISASKSFDIYNAAGITFADSQITLPAGNKTLTLFNARLAVTNSSPTGVQPVTFDGLTTNGYANTLSLYNASASLSNTNLLGAVPVLTTGGTTLTISNNLTLLASSVLNYVLGTNADTIAVKSNLTFAGTANVTAGGGFGAGTYTLATYGKNLISSSPTLGTTPSGYNYSFNTGTAGQVNLVVVPLAAGIPTNLTASATNLLIKLNWFSSSNAASYNLKRSTTNGGPYGIIANVAATNYSDANVMPGTNYFYVVSATNAAGESANSVQASAAPLPSNQPTNLAAQFSGGQLQLAWPQDHLGWRLQIQTNDLSGGLRTNWVTVPNSTNFNTFNLFAGPTNGSVFLRLVYP